jgi:CBS domain-containing protein
MYCRDVMMTKVFTCRRDEPVSRCAEVMRDERIGLVPIVDEGDVVVGVLTDRDLAIRVIADRRSLQTPAGEVMSTGPLTVCRPDDDLQALEARMAHDQKSRVLVLSAEGRCVGIVSLSDVARFEKTAQAGEVLKKVAHRESALITRS